MSEFAFPFRIDGRGRTADRSFGPHIRDLIEQFLFTAPGERPNRPTLGSGVQQLLFGPNSPDIASAVQYTLQSGLQQYLGDRVQVQGVEVANIDARLEVTVRYLLLGETTVQSATFVRNT